MNGTEGAARLTHGQVMESALITVGYTETFAEDLDYAAEVLKRAVAEAKVFDRSVNYREISDKEKKKAVLTLQTMYLLESKFGQKSTA